MTIGLFKAKRLSLLFQHIQYKYFPFCAIISPPEKFYKVKRKVSQEPALKVKPVSLQRQHCFQSAEQSLCGSLDHQVQQLIHQLCLKK